ncbi:MBOAT family protein [Anaerotignum lactatifermentans]|uniref:MBOAT family protein n=1 Tax=Anaerotignum lactatifermentans TaxID=160404 RepID=A0ABS2GBP5_9FIRM|nr:MBOAT family O-acyltransferase [Anaerotignum lactatifermentans]MBM6828551.1 MBOAT family protein [Anaerotignum lactatifermentans]MBM6877958.1 MBOAT family protein [Anaerotignum lactatifermentans]MBM6950133.1 MBOAT family protein [Anaerotignum lactatifermentans]
MDFGSIPFILWFLPAFLIGYYIFTSEQWRKFWIIAATVIFYGISCGMWTAALLAMTAAAILGAYSVKEKGKPALAVFILLFLGILIYTKISGNFMPGVSFLVFTMLSMLIYIYRNKEVQYHFSDLAAYILFFPKLLSGPIAQIGDMPDHYVTTVANRKDAILRRIENGLIYFIIGLGYKVLLANQLSGLWREVQTIGIPSISTPLAWMGILAFTLQLYFDFQGYSLMAIGIGRMIGVYLPENFDLPYLSRSVSEFYRRWHMTLGRWFREYVYFPMGGSKKGLPQTILNLLAVWLLTGLWHGIGPSFLLWGLFLFFWIALEKIFLKRFLTGFFGHIYVWLLLPMSWVFFALDDLADIKWFFLRLFAPILGNSGINVSAGDYLKYGSMYWPFLLIGICLLFIAPEKWMRQRRDKWYVILLLTVIFWGSVYLLAQGVNNPFMYFSF